MSFHKSITNARVVLVKDNFFSLDGHTQKTVILIGPMSGDGFEAGMPNHFDSVTFGVPGNNCDCGDSEMTTNNPRRTGKFPGVRLTFIGDSPGKSPVHARSTRQAGLPQATYLGTH